MPPNEDDDDYVAQLLAQDAKNSSMKYSALGMQAYMPKRPTTGAPKPNTRFLKNILRSTDSHNAALKRKEEEEARDRKRLDQEDHHGDRHAKRRRAEERPERKDDRERERSHRSRKSKEGRYVDEESERRRRHRERHRGERETKHSESSTATRTGERVGRHGHRTRRRDRDSPDDRASRRYEGDDYKSRHSRHRSSRHRSYSRSRSRSRSPERSERRRGRGSGGHHRSRRRRDRSPSSRSPSRTRDKSRSNHQAEPTSRKHHEEEEERIPSSPDSDPLSHFVGPLPPSKANGDAPPVRSRGRGAYKPSAMDDHFADNYDPTLDIQPNDDETDQGTSMKSTRRPVPGLATEDDDWDMALEALRDRALWKRNGADRLREAGFGEDVVDKWSSNGAFAGLGGGDKEKGVDDVRWAKKGEGREWDRGKVVDEDGHIDVKAAW